MKSIEKKTNQIWLLVVSVGVVIAIILGVVGLVNPNDTTTNAIPTINQQVENINNTLPELERVSTELNGYIDALETTMEKLQTDLTATNTAIDTLVTEREGRLSESEQKVLGELNSLKTSIEGQLATVSDDIAMLKTKDAKLSVKISDLKTYVDDEIKATEDWANATFMTLTQYSAIETELSSIKTSITTINLRIATIESDLTTKIDEINSSIDELGAEFAAEITKVTDDYTAAIAAFKTETEAAYTTAITNAITVSEISMKTWVNDELQKVYGKITVLQEQVDALDSSEVTDAELATAVSQQQQALDDAVVDLKAYIDSIIADNGTANTALAELNTKLDAIGGRLTNLENRVTQLENKVDSMNQSCTIRFLPTYSEGKAAMDYQTKTATINFLTSGVFVYNVDGLSDNCDVYAYLYYVSDSSDHTSNDANTLEWKQLEVVSAKTLMPNDQNNLIINSGYVLQVTLNTKSYIFENDTDIIGTEDLSDNFWSGNEKAMLYIRIDGKEESGLPNMILSDVVPLVPYGYNP